MIHETFSWIVDKIIFKPLYRLYMQVWWKNQSDSHICTALSPGTSVTFWETHAMECSEVIYTQFQVVYTAITCGLWFVFLYQLYNLMWHTCIVARAQRQMLHDVVRMAMEDVRRQSWARIANQEISATPD